eukprot:TRINITY_DN11432_c0_g1_i4.p1 TRINITY_DN11432_c0_g1~~TRINITY_DN11432_c0_g1_i4.p1  ORF type:complete len:512 (+),score=156.40 TRINITY_DN11432_c0_g1_i4:141-1538(+)
MRVASPDFAFSHPTLWPLQQQQQQQQQPVQQTVRRIQIHQPTSPSASAPASAELQMLRSEVQALSAAQKDQGRRLEMVLTSAGQCRCGCSEKVAELKRDLAALQGWIDGMQQSQERSLQQLRSDLAQHVSAQSSAGLPDDISSQISGLADAAAAVRGEMAELRQELNRSCEKYDSLQREQQTSRQGASPDALADLQKSVAAAQGTRDDLDRLKGAVSQMQTARQRDCDGVDSVRSDLEQLKCDVAELRAARHTDGGALADLHGAVGDLRGAVVVMRAELDGLADDVHRGRQADAVASGDAAAVEGQLRALDDKIDSGIGDLRQALAELQSDSTAEQIRSLSNAVDAVRAEVAKVSARQDAQESGVQRAAGEYHNAVAQIHDLQTEVQLGKEDIDHAKRQSEESRKTAGELRGFTEELSKTMDIRIAELHNKVNDIEKDLQTELTKARRTIQREAEISGSEGSLAA